MEIGHLIWWGLVLLLGQPALFNRGDGARPDGVLETLSARKGGAGGDEQAILLFAPAQSWASIASCPGDFDKHIMLLV